jgi:Trk K+ transport system NAD-binding subunit
VDVDAPESDAEVLSDHIIIIGMNSMGRRIAVQLHDQGETVLAIDTDINKVKDLECKSMLGNVEYLQVLEEAGFDRAKLVVSTLHIEDTNNLVAYHSQQAGVPCVVHGFDATVHDALKELGVTYLIDSKKAGMGVLVDRVLDLELQ